MPTPTEVGNFQRILLSLSALGARAVRNMWTDVSDSQTLKETFPPTIDPFVAAAGVLAAEWYSGLSDVPFDTRVSEPPALQVLAETVGWAFTQADPLNAAIGSTERHIFTAARDTVVDNATREGVRFARYASANACPWCRVLATRKPVFKDAGNAVRGHNNCHCIAVPVRPGDTYSPPDYVKTWLDDYNAARDEVGGNLDDITNYLRRTQNLTPAPSG